MAIYTMPKVQIGDLVFWYPGGDSGLEPTPGIVTNVGERALAISLLAKDNYSVLPKDAVRHLSDPALLAVETREHGSWDYAPATKLMYEMESSIKDILIMLKRTKS